MTLIRPPSAGLGRLPGLAAAVLLMLGGLVLGGEPASSDDELADLELEVSLAEPAEAVNLLAAHLDRPPAGLAPVIADILSRSDGLPAEVQEKLFTALLPHADRRTFEPARRMLDAADHALVRFGLELLARTEHPEARAAILGFHGRTVDERLRPLAVAALGELGDRAALPTVEQLRTAAAPDERQEAAIAAARLGGRVDPAELIGINGDIRNEIRGISGGLGYARRTDPAGYRSAIRRIEELERRATRLGGVLGGAARERPGETFEAVLAITDPAVAEWFSEHVATLVERLDPADVARIREHVSPKLAVRTLALLAGRDDVGRAAIGQAAVELLASSDARLRERAYQLADHLPAELAAEVRRRQAAERAVAPLEPGAARPRPRPRPDFDLILWGGGYPGTPADQERDVRYYKDLGFTHQLALVAGGEREIGATESWLGICQRHGLFPGLRFGWDVSELGMAPTEMAERGMLLHRARAVEPEVCNPLHPEIIRFFTDRFVTAVDRYRRCPGGDEIRLFLMGSEQTWSLPRREEDSYPAALRILFAAAREDGVLGPDAPDAVAPLAGWWHGAHERGRDWRLRRAFEAEILERIPDAEFMIDPLSCIKIVNGFGSTWTYISGDPKRIAAATLILSAVTRPAAAAHGTQLQREFWGGRISHDALQEANLLAICMGADKLVHWGIHGFEPGREANLTYGVKKWKPTPPGFPEFRVDHLPDWRAFLAALGRQRSGGGGRRLWESLDPASRGTLERAILLEEMEATTVDPEVEDEAVRALNAVLVRRDLYDEATFAGLPLAKRTAALAGRARAGRLADEDLPELNRLLIEAIFAAVPPSPADPEGMLAAIPPTPSPNLRELRENCLWLREQLEPAIRSTGRLLRERGGMFRDWKPLEPRLALVSAAPAELTMPLLVGQIPFEILGNFADRRSRLPGCRFAAITQPTVAAEDYADLLKLEEAGGTVFVPPGFVPPAGAAALARPVELGGLGTPLSGTPAELRRQHHERARELRRAVHEAGLRPFFDSDNPDVVLRGFSYRGRPIVFAVNDLRREEDFPGILADKGLPNEVDLLIRDRRPRLRVIDLDSGEDVAAVRQEDGWHVRETIEPAWYRMFVVLGEGETWTGPPPLPPAAAVQEFAAAREAAGGVRLSWKLPFEDWVGCDVARYRVFRADGGASPALLADIQGRILTGAGGLVTSWLDSAAVAGTRCEYQIQAVTPLRRPGPMSDRVPCR